ncbi:hypothetical protein [Mycobacterium paragordonae]|uniref:Uncharacterized protein n=1 Tax=Mycobacterium paragordonae TaxID=1389713 RepID=A0AAJ1S8R2_9MYCO|nr:hypothetical protein [Mycobacterium paragordonae]MDP7739616.1 hypothetical protein [Mycobacterium paragordonae]
MRCSNCGKDIPFSGKVCPYCHVDKGGDQTSQVFAFIGAFIGALVGAGIAGGMGGVIGGIVGCIGGFILAAATNKS